MKITGVDFVTVPTRDFEQASEFYGALMLHCRYAPPEG